jgi:monovalent cation/hydrogen antiporter
VEDVTPSGKGCQECVAQGATWVHLRMCLSCGHVGCCDSSTGKHARSHHRATQHPVMRSFEDGEHWTWCFVHEEAHLGMPGAGSGLPAAHGAEERRKTG